jgi:hypothetical protein
VFNDSNHVMVMSRRVRERDDGRTFDPSESIEPSGMRVERPEGGKFNPPMKLNELLRNINEVAEKPTLSGCILAKN